MPAVPSGRHFRVAVVGGGISGLVITTVLRRAGVECRLFERTHAFGAVGAGIQLSPNGVRVLHRLGLADALDTDAVRARSIETRRWDDGRTLARVPHGTHCEERFGAPYLLIHRADLQRHLVAALPPGSVELGRACIGVAERDDGVEVRFEDGESVTADLVIGADGVHSAVRPAVVADRRLFSGYSVHRAVIPADVVPSFRDNPRVVFWLGPDRHVTYYPIEGGRRVHFSAVGVSTDETSRTTSSPAEAARLAADFTGWHPEVLDVLNAAPHVTRWGVFDRDLAERYATDRVVLVGDAAHPMLPYLSQGANQALEDAAELTARLLELADPGKPAEALRRYEEARLPRTARVHAGSRALAETFHLADGKRQTARDRELAAAADLTHLDWLYGHGRPQPAPTTT
ncbi:FAD-dependent monooxygenase [Streptomyces sp. OF3]|uniref:FAD-dependent monooxygenase n=1 Tax=Streptomyces alkaliterrae TaxID=2213162 RepID=A0A7W3WPE2_9ACTN|nr:FAD-dependent monooxygenase [Streptomyces alkaliterrae]MBB1256088.1 FAD-dependent monooxygenase [Streptomyces alkaliterrae]